MGFIEMLKLIIGLFPMLIQAIKAVEAAIPEAGKGSEKLELIKNAVQAAYEASTSVASNFEVLWPALSKTINSIVNAFNKTGVFTKNE